MNVDNRFFEFYEMITAFVPFELKILIMFGFISMIYLLIKERNNVNSKEKNIKD